MNDALTPAENERVALIAEECGEVVQVVGKILRHGLESWNPVNADHRTNRQLLEVEIGHVLTATDMLCSVGVLDMGSIERARIAKHASVVRWLHFYEPPAPRDTTDPGAVQAPNDDDGLLVRDREWLIGATDAVLSVVAGCMGRSLDHATTTADGECALCAAVADELERVLVGTVPLPPAPRDTPKEIT